MTLEDIAQPASVVNTANTNEPELSRNSGQSKRRKASDVVRYLVDDPQVVADFDRCMAGTTAVPSQERPLALVRAYEAMARASVSHAAARAGAILVGLVNWRHGYGYIKYKTLAGVMGCSERSAISAVGDLIAAKVIVRRRCAFKTGKGGQAANHFVVPALAGIALAAVADHEENFMADHEENFMADHEENFMADREENFTLLPIDEHNRLKKSLSPKPSPKPSEPKTASPAERDASLLKKKKGSTAAKRSAVDAALAEIGVEISDTARQIMTIQATARYAKEDPRHDLLVAFARELVDLNADEPTLKAILAKLVERRAAALSARSKDGRPSVFWKLDPGALAKTAAAVDAEVRLRADWEQLEEIVKTKGEEARAELAALNANQDPTGPQKMKAAVDRYCAARNGEVVWPFSKSGMRVFIDVQEGVPGEWHDVAKWIAATEGIEAGKAMQELVTVEKRRADLEMMTRSTNDYEIAAAVLSGDQLGRLYDGRKRFAPHTKW